METLHCYFKKVLGNSLVIPFSCVKMTGTVDLNSHKMEAYYSHTKLSHSVVATGNLCGMDILSMSCLKPLKTLE